MLAYKLRIVGSSVAPFIFYDTGIFYKGYSTFATRPAGGTTFNDDNFFIRMQLTASDNNDWRTVSTENPIDLTKYSVAKIEWEAPLSRAYSTARFSVGDNYDDITSDAVIIKSSTFSKMIDEIDISDVSGYKHIRATVRLSVPSFAGSTSMEQEIYVYKIWLE